MGEKATGMLTLVASRGRVTMAFPTFFSEAWKRRMYRSSTKGIEQ